jgi:hypothetical protein
VAALDRLSEAGSPRSWLKVATGAVLAIALVGCASSAPSTPGASSSHPGSRSPDATPTDSPSLTASARPSASAAAQHEWEVAAFGHPLAFAYDVVSSPAGLVAVGLQYDGLLPIVGPSPPHEGRIWISAGGGPWQDVTPRNLFTNVSLQDAFVRADGTLVAIGGISEHTDISGPMVHQTAYGAWESSDGRTWQPSSTGLPEGAAIWQVENGGRGYLARISPAGATHSSELWFSADGRTWDLVRELLNGAYVVGAGDEGFVVVGSQVPPHQSTWEPFAIASSDGVEWFESPSPPPDAIDVAPIGGDWIAISYTFGDVSRSGEVTTWFSANGLDWTRHGEVIMGRVEAGDGSCPELPTGLSSAGGWLVMGSNLGSLRCGEGGLVVHGTQRISSDGSSWTALPFEPGTPGESGSGSQVYAAATDGPRLILVGQMNGQAALWSLPLR